MKQCKKYTKLLIQYVDIKYAKRLSFKFSAFGLENTLHYFDNKITNYLFKFMQTI